MQTTRCIHELIRDQCAVCTGREGFEEEEPGPLFQARFKGYCYGCSQQVEPGDDLRMWEGNPHHTFCLPERFLEEYG